MATLIECYSQVFILHNPIEYALIVVMSLTIASHFFNSWILLICGCLVWFCRPTTKLHNQVVYQVQNFILQPGTCQKDKDQHQFSFLLVLVKHILDHHLSFKFLPYNTLSRPRSKSILNGFCN